MCLGIPGQVVEVLEGNAGLLALVDVLGAQRPINLGMLEDPVVEPGQWVLIHMGFAVELIDEAQASEARSGLELMGNTFEQPSETAASTRRWSSSERSERSVETTTRTGVPGA